MTDLRELREETREKYNNAKNATEDGWERFKGEVSDAVDKMERGWDNFVADLKS
jgi:hypothetical protein